MQYKVLVKTIFIAIFSISIKAIKFEEITVTFQPSKPKTPTIVATEKAQPSSGITTNLIFLKISHRVIMINKNTPTPKTTISL